MALKPRWRRAAPAVAAMLLLGLGLGPHAVALAAADAAAAAAPDVPPDMPPELPDMQQKLEELRRMALEQARHAQQLALQNRLDWPGQLREHASERDDDGGGRSVDEHRALNADGRVFVRNVSGSVAVSAWDRSDVAITGDLGSDADHLEISGDPASLSVVVQPPRHAHSSDSADLRLMVPAGAKVSVETVSADIAVHGTRGAVKVTSVSGDVGLAVDAAEVTAQTVSGDLILQGPSADTVANSVSGDLRMSGLQGRLAAETVSGHVELAGGKFSELRLKSISGDMHLDVSLVEHAAVVGETLSGDISLLVPADLSGTAMLKSFSGEAQCDVAQTGASSAVPGRKHEREYTFGDGKGVTMSLSTFSGDIHVERK
jgi:hypothetical protein